MYFEKIKEQFSHFFPSPGKKKIKITCHLVREGMLFRKQHTTNEIEISKLAS